MSVLILGLVLFLAGHSLKVFWPFWRERQIARWGANRFKGAYSLVALTGLLLVIWGYGQARLEPVVLWAPVRGLQHLAIVLMLLSTVLAVAAGVPRNALARRVRHPLTLSVKVWALAHLLANHTLADAVLFGSLLLWSVLVFRSARQRDRHAVSPARADPSRAATIAAVVGGVAVWAVLLLGGHRALVGVSPLG